jgi:signal transduction histidine kinase
MVQDPAPVTVDTSLRESLLLARDRLGPSLENRDDLGLDDAASGKAILERMVDELLSRLEGGEPAALPDIAEVPARLRLIQLYQSELLHVWSRLSGEQPGSGTVLGVLSELDQMRVSLEPHGRERVQALMDEGGPMNMVVQLAHDLRSPLTSILFLAELVQRGRSGPVTEAQQRQLGVIYSAAFALVAIANDVIELARGGGVRLTDEEPVPFSLNECLGSISEMLAPMAEDKGIDLRISTPRDDRRIGRPSAISRAILNLATNGLKFTEEGFVEIAAEVAEWDRIRFSVTDTGRGMSPEAERNLFQPFHKSSGRKGVFFSGSGLGLSIVRRIVDELGGTLTYETRLHQGTRFEFTLKLPSASDHHAL